MRRHNDFRAYVQRIHGAAIAPPVVAVLSLLMNGSQTTGQSETAAKRLQENEKSFSLPYVARRAERKKNQN